MTTHGLLSPGGIPTQFNVPSKSVKNPIGAFTGAKGDGVTDDTAVIQAWIDYVEAHLDLTRVVFFPAGNYIVSGITKTTATLLGEQSSRAVASIATLATNLGSRLIHKAGATTPLITVLGGVTGLGWDRIEALTLQGKQNQNTSVPRRAIVSSADRRHITVAVGDLPTVNLGFFPGYGVCMFYDANGYRLGSGIVQSVNGGTGEITLYNGTDNYTGKAGAGNLLTNTETVAFSPSASYVGDGIAIGPIPDSTMISPPAILNMGRSRVVRDVYIKDFHCGIVMSDSTMAIKNVWTNNCGLAGIAMRNPGSGADVSGEGWYIQGGNFEDMGQAPIASRFDPGANMSLCGLWGLPGISHIDDVVTNFCYHAVVDAGSGGTHFGSFLADLPFKEAFLTWGGLWGGGVADPTISFDWFQARTLGQGFTTPLAQTYPSGSRAIFGITFTAANQRKIAVGVLTVPRDPSSLPADDFAAVCGIATKATNGRHEVTVENLAFRAGLTAMDNGVYPSRTAKRESSYENLVTPPWFSYALLGIAIGGVPFVPRGIRWRITKNGTLADVISHVTAAAGNLAVAIYDTGDAAGGGTRTLLYSSGALAVPALGAWRVIASPNLPVVAGQEVDVFVVFDNAGANVLRFANAAASGIQLPTGVEPVPGGALPKILLQLADIGSLVGWPATLAEAAVAITGNTYSLLGRLSQ